MNWTVLNLAKAFTHSGDNGVRMLVEGGCEVVSTQRPCPLSVDDLKTELPGVDAVIAASDDFCAELLGAEEAKDLKIIQRWGVGYDAIDVEAATSAGIVVGYLPGFLDDVVADYHWALMLGMARRIPWGQASMLEGTWKPAWGHDVVGRTLGIVGCGRIGTAVARRARGFEMRVLGFDPMPSDTAREAGVEFVSLEELLEQSDFVSLNTAATSENRGIIGEPELRRMKESAYLINTARGSLLDEAAMVRALGEGWIAGAALDCFEKEPLAADHPLRSAPNILLCPHMAPFAWGNAQEMNHGAAQTILDLKAGKQPELVVNPEVFGSDALRAEPI
ncbi:MAG: phosphoglycerate dehydrogenase [Verrucomicrobiota bacterium]|nr:phosphoglycerate dehydrogenase [Verrucomicrobiota bacterium]